MKTRYQVPACPAKSPQAESGKVGRIFHSRSKKPSGRALGAISRSHRLFVGIVLVSFCGGPASAQQFGQWSWEGFVGAGRRTYRNFINGGEISSLDQRDLRFSVGIKGFIIHPAVARFNVGVDGLFSDYEGTRSLDSNDWGLRGDLSLFPLGKYPILAFARRGLFDYSGITEHDPLTLRGLPDTSTTWGGRLRMRDGLLRGALFGVERTSLDFLAPGTGNEVQEREFVDWARAGAKLKRHFRLERRFRELGTVDYKTDNVAANFSQLGKVADSLHWHLFGTATHQSQSFNGGRRSSFDTVRFRNQFLFEVRDDDLLDLSYSGGLTSGLVGGLFQSHALSARYRWRPKEPWEVSPFAVYGMQASLEYKLNSPQVGITTSWNRPGGMLDISLTQTTSLSLLQLNRGDDSRKDTRVGLSAGGSVAQGNESSLRTEVEGAWSRDQLRLGAEAIITLPEFMQPLAGGGSEDFFRGRITLRRRWRSCLFSGYSEWYRRATVGLATADFYVDGFTQTIQVTGSRFSFGTSLGKTRVKEPEPQNVRFISTSLSFRPWRLLSLNASYRADDRQLLLAPNVDGEQAEAGAELRLGAFDIRFRTFFTTERRITQEERTNRGMTWALSRRFQGWLPFVTSGPRRGGVN